MSRVSNLIFDLDGTLYPYSEEVEANVDERIKFYLRPKTGLSENEISAFMCRVRAQGKYEAEAVEAEFRLNKADFMEYICDVDVAMLAPNPQLSALLAQINQRKVIFTDSTRQHVLSVLRQIQVAPELFAEIIDAHALHYNFKYNGSAFVDFFAVSGLVAAESIIFEDSCANIKNAKQYGLTTVQIAKPGAAKIPEADYYFADINSALHSLLPLL